jgi:DNA mismatch repair protein MutL
MGIIRELPASVVNQIAAGEVIERPASVVKELLENAIDAGALRVELTIERGGRDLIRVADDGSGLVAEDLPLAFRPHATSKLTTAEDLAQIRTLGFRGEALAAIAEVARVRCQSRPAGQETGSEIEISGGAQGPVRPCAASPGTVVEVRNLFFNVPVRRGFLKSDSTEASHVVEMFTRVALAHPHVQFTLVSGRRTVHDLPATSGMKDRIAVFFGQELADALLWVESRIENIHLRGYVAHPSQSRSTSKGQYLFIGGRYVRDRSLSAALSESYRGLLMVGRQPVAFLHLDLPFEDVDVNVHPTKIEVRFRDSHRVYSQVLSTLRQTFLASDLHARLQAPPEEPLGGSSASAAPARPAAAAAAQRPSPGRDTLELWPGRVERQQVATWFSGDRPPHEARAGSAEGAPARATLTDLRVPEGYGQPPTPAWADRLPPVSPSSDFDEFASEGLVQGPRHAEPEPTPTPPASDADRAASQGSASVWDEAGASRGSTRSAAESSPHRSLMDHVTRALQVHDSYLIAETDEGVLVIDQHALHERILYEELRGRVEQGGVESQRLLAPEPVDLTAADAAALLEQREVLGTLGLEIEPFGGSTVNVTATPALLAHVPPLRLVQDLADHFRNNPLPPTADGLLEHVLATFACKAAIKAGQKLSAAEIEALLERRHLAANTHHCPHGRPASLVFTKAELERQFGRI